MYITLSNDFHNTATRIRVPKGMPEIFLTDAQARRIGNRLCGSEGCTCSGVLGIRGRQEPFRVKEQWCRTEFERWYHGWAPGNIPKWGYLISIVAD